MEQSFKFNLGDEVKEQISGFKGIVVAAAVYDTGCRHYGVKPRKLKETGEPQDWQWVDESRLVLLKSKVIEPKKAPDRSGPYNNPIQVA